MGMSKTLSCRLLLETLDKLANLELLPRSRVEGGGKVVMRRMRPPNARIPPQHLQCESARRVTGMGAPFPLARPPSPPACARTATRRTAAALTVGLEVYSLSGEPTIYIKRHYVTHGRRIKVSSHQSKTLTQSHTHTRRRSRNSSMVRMVVLARQVALLRSGFPCTPRGVALLVSHRVTSDVC